VPPGAPGFEKCAKISSSFTEGKSAQREDVWRQGAREHTIEGSRRPGVFGCTIEEKILTGRGKENAFI
jgi:protein involved in temperature-dependent protein secretion